MKCLRCGDEFKACVPGDTSEQEAYCQCDCGGFYYPMHVEPSWCLEVREEVEV